jgi:hypothetical protein
MMSFRFDARRLQWHRYIEADSAQPRAVARRSDPGSNRFQLSARLALAAWLAGFMLGALLIVGLAGVAVIALRLLR